jgi:hypothetical protein
MNKTTLLWFINDLSLVFNSSVDSFFSSSIALDATTAGAFAGAFSVRDKGLYKGVVACLATDWVRAAASAPEIRSRSV